MSPSPLRAGGVVALVALACVLLLASPAPVAADTSANCTYADVLGTWQISLSTVMPTPTSPSLHCEFDWPVTGSVLITFSYPNVAKMYDGEEPGNWTLIYNQGVEAWVNGAMGFFFFAHNEKTGAYDCSVSQVGWYHQADGSDWQCFHAKKIADDVSGVVAPAPAPSAAALDAEARRQASLKDPRRLATPFRTDHGYLAKLNSAAEGWFTVKEYPEFEEQTIGELERQSGSTDLGGMLESMLPPTARQVSEPRLSASAIPQSFDWRNVSGENFVSPVRSQASCGSCYAFAALAMMEARIRVKSGNKQQPFLSPQDVVSCSNYAQGCNGGFPYLIGGKYGRDYGFVEEACYPYVAKDTTCNPNPQPGCNPKRWRTAEYYYIGGFYGQSTEQLMQEEILANGPIAVSFMVYPDLRQYSGGVYTHKFARDLHLEEYNPFHLTNHVVIITGWGVTNDDKKIPYWIVKNSWGNTWGEQGYFRILRGSTEAGGECAIESLTVSAIPVLH